jgi:Phage integrase, N-terminal SAM-like domain
MSDHTLLGPWIRRFLLEHVVAERNLARNTQHSYRDAFSLLIPFAAKKQKKSVDRLAVVDLSADIVRRFLADLESARSCKIATRNQRLAAIRAFAGFVAEHNPVHIEWCGQIRSIPFKKAGKAVVPYLEKVEMDACWPPQIVEPRKAGVITRFCCFSTMPAPEPRRQLSSKSATSISLPLAQRLLERAESSAFAPYGLPPSPNSARWSADALPPNLSSLIASGIRSPDLGFIPWSSVIR